MEVNLYVVAKPFRWLEKNYLPGDVIHLGPGDASKLSQLRIIGISVRQHEKRIDTEIETGQVNQPETRRRGRPRKLRR